MSTLTTLLATAATSLLSSTSQTVYSFKDLSGAFAHCTAGTFTFGGETSYGINQITVSYTSENTYQEVAVDGGIYVTPIPTYNGMVTIDCQQTSYFNQFLLNWYNTLKTEAAAGTVDNWANASMILVKSNAYSSSSKTTHTITGISPQKRPDEPYAAQGGNIIWSLMAANITS